jgi:hypothetical protein
MTAIPQVARAMREILTTTAVEAGRTTRFVQRTSPLNGATCSQTWVCGFLGHPPATLEELTQTAAALGVESSPQALEQRLTASAAACLHQVLVTAIARVLTAEPVAMPLLQRFTAVYGQDSSTLVFPEVFAAQWHGCGGSPSSSASAALTFRTLFPGSMRVFRGVLLKQACTGYRKPLQRVSLGFFLMSSRHHTNVVPGETASGYRRRAACSARNGSVPRLGSAASVSQGTCGSC